MTTPIPQVAVCGAGAMGSGIAQVAAQAGAQVFVFDTSTDALASGEARIRTGLEGQVSRGKLAQAEADRILAALTWTNDLDRLRGAGLVIEAIVEDLAVKQSLFARLEAALPGDAILATNTSSLPIGRLARGLNRPDRFVGMHFFNPAPVMKLVEIVSGPATSPEIAAIVAATASAWGKIAIPVADVPGFIVNRVARPFYAEAFLALQHGVAPEVIDLLFRSAAGFRMGPLELTDLIGQDVNFAVARSVYDSYFGVTRFTPQLAQARLVDAGRLGRKTGRGVYRYDGASHPLPVPLETAAAAPIDLAPLLEGDALALGEVLVRRTRGLTAKREARLAGHPVVLFDWFDPANAAALGFAASEPDAVAAGSAVAAALGLPAHLLPDRPGLIVARTLAQLANAAGDAVLDKVSDPESIDAALRHGANYPFGPCAWAARIGAAHLCRLLDSIWEETGVPLYRPSPYWRSVA